VQYGTHTYIGKSTDVAYVTNTSNAFSKSFTYNGQGLPQTMKLASSAGDLTFVYDGLGNLVGLIDDNQTINGSSNDLSRRR
jgi:YD repeat-containing protein